MNTTTRNAPLPKFLRLTHFDGIPHAANPETIKCCEQVADWICRQYNDANTRRLISTFASLILARYDLDEKPIENFDKITSILQEIALSTQLPGFCEEKDFLEEENVLHFISSGIHKTIMAMRKNTH